MNNTLKGAIAGTAILLTGLFIGMTQSHGRRTRRRLKDLERAHYQNAHKVEDTLYKHDQRIGNIGIVTTLNTADIRIAKTKDKFQGA